MWKWTETHMAENVPLILRRGRGALRALLLLRALSVYLPVPCSREIKDEVELIDANVHAEHLPLGLEGRQLQRGGQL